MFFIRFWVKTHKFRLFGFLVDFICKTWQNLGIFIYLYNALQEKILSNLTNKKTVNCMSKKKILLTQISLLMVVVLFLADKSMVFSWIKNFVNMTHSAELEYIFTQLFLPSKAIYELSQVFSFLCFVKMLLVVSAVAVLVLLLFVNVVRHSANIKKAQSIKVSEVAENNQFTYKMQEKFLC